jgi:sarcosine oxidase delta subunit
MRKSSNLFPTIRSAPATPEYEERWEHIFGCRKPAYQRSVAEATSASESQALPDSSADTNAARLSDSSE